MDPTQTASDKNKGQHSCPEPRKDGRSKGEKRTDKRINSRQTGCPSIHLSRVIHFLVGMSSPSSTKSMVVRKGVWGETPYLGRGKSEREKVRQKERPRKRETERDREKVIT